MVIKLVLVFILKKGLEIQKISLSIIVLDKSTFTNMFDIFMMVSETCLDNPYYFSLPADFQLRKSQKYA